MDGDSIENSGESVTAGDGLTYAISGENNTIAFTATGASAATYTFVAAGTGGAVALNHHASHGGTLATGNGSVIKGIAVANETDNDGTGITIPLYPYLSPGGKPGL
jgi:hypothetical protein